MKIGINGLNLIKEFEGLRLQAYKCPSDIWTIGYGHTAGIGPDDVITEAQAISLLCQDVAASERAVNQYTHVLLTQNQFDALVSFVFNLGVGSFRTSTLLKKLNAGDYDGAAREFGRWIHAGGKALPGLVRRREAERALFLK
ncbi:TPA: lysozyme [Salmonella enterica subsp. enterica serovar Ball]|uniref:Lysozyme n=1 Tax=Salmonella enterica subsp. salamae TaxID=59202 RepID=A0A5Y2S8H4_SALER|nr:lysozyme [Salmonella enterica subsp. salamae]EGS6537726.1 lysozyme [Salmonella enterica]HCA3435112.1 lysozyme [Salmonella enterica subsp. enterica serovar Ball]ECJ2314390.1 lysozyme [Salmonella enterica subsp. salamae]EDV0263018.1 lysozyme [Salmonella enterica subsp. salamae]